MKRSKPFQKPLVMAKEKLKYFFINKSKNVNKHPVARNADEIRLLLKKVPIELGQLDVNGLCNAKCWYCPVKYEGNLKKYAENITLIDLEIILNKLRSSRLIAANVNSLFTCHYNEVLLYPHFAELIELFRKYKFVTSIFSNATPLTPQKIDLILGNKDVIQNIILNIPALEKKEWTMKMGLSNSNHKKLIRNLDYLHNSIGNSKYKVTVVINTNINEKPLRTRFDNSSEEAINIAGQFRNKYPRFHSNLEFDLSDRAGKLSENNILIQNHQTKNKVIGCQHYGTSRIYKWFHINTKGDLFLCCDDFNMEYKFGNLLDRSFEDIWISDEHVNCIVNAQNSICTMCKHKIEDAQ